jgi:Xaa-Pro dipeptidase
MLAFPVPEYQARLDKTKRCMAEAGLDVLLVTNPANMNYLSGYDGWSFYVHQLLVLPIDASQPMWIGRGIDSPGARLTTWLDPAHIIPYPDDYVQSTTKHPMDFVSQYLREIRRDRGAIGVEMDTYYYTARAHARLERGLPDATFRDVTSLVNRVRMIKSDRELGYMRRAARIAERAMDAGISSIAEGVRECDAAASVFHAQISGTESFGGDYPAIVPLMPSGEKTSACHLTWTDECYRAGQSVTIELAGCYRRYHAPLSRTVVIGHPPAKVKDLAEIVVEGIAEVLDTIKPGIRCEDVERTWSGVLAQRGLKKDDRMGYSTGLNYPPDWGEHTASLRKGDRTVLQPNMTFHLMPGMWYQDYGVEISETVRVTEDGCEVLARFPRQLFVK